MLKIRELPSAERPRERLQNQGPSALRESELLAILLRTGTSGISAVQLGEALLKKFYSLDGIAQAALRDLAQIKGVGITKAIQLKAAFEMGSRLRRQLVQQRKIETPDAVYELLGEELKTLQYESVRVILLNAKRLLISIEEISRGLLDQTLAHPREVFSSAIARRAHAVILVHNHPSGDPSPSIADMQMTQTLLEASRILEIALFDHVIIGKKTVDFPEGWFSFRSANRL
jgi:DNA repair protein RadC